MTGPSTSNPVISSHPRIYHFARSMFAVAVVTCGTCEFSNGMCRCTSPWRACSASRLFNYPSRWSPFAINGSGMRLSCMPSHMSTLWKTTGLQHDEANPTESGDCRTHSPFAAWWMHAWTCRTDWAVKRMGLSIGLSGAIGLIISTLVLVLEMTAWKSKLVRSKSHQRRPCRTRWTCRRPYGVLRHQCFSGTPPHEFRTKDLSETNKLSLHHCADALRNCTRYE
jgi:hypothetical protein